MRSPVRESTVSDSPWYERQLAVTSANSLSNTTFTFVKVDFFVFAEKYEAFSSYIQHLYFYVKLDFLLDCIV